ncbi:MAG: hypothetical protein A2431_04170 [Candidatus Zambryskibacteria bacterium RIFOXYC1_FULL_39_10]|uniref:Uncharacterized protein n=1 Tax=Candidatus Zambryskibacteria bacterium RIFOXYC1_FULL_39_10 TaxID=1802779 RepID=A0A1G2UZ17_9BACT|nr:MAG: hypothetical protein A2431_04170 [Candidatus Zambryskibacteria bacterium RIFOXYC1_FULL_39_10]OHB16660.1 MAG: hypothetical protein A2605_00690 [Candidatus Zambryskibacteria bacterium RIFOXYD1_FULL_39_35]
MKISKLISTIFIFTLIVSFFVSSTEVSAASCPDDWNYTPQIEVNIASNTFYSDSGGSVNLPYGVSIPFTVGSHNHPPSSIITITYPYGSVATYPSQSDGTFRSLTIPAINEAVNGERSLNVSLNPNCTYVVGLPQQGEPAPTVNLNIPIYVTAPSTCTIDTFICSVGVLSWSTSNCTTRSIDNGIGSVGPAGNTAGTNGTTYVMQASNSGSSKTSSATCPNASLSASWNQTGTTNLIINNVTPGQVVPLSFKFWKVGDGSLKFSRCFPGSGAIPSNNILVICPTPFGAEISNYP